MLLFNNHQHQSRMHRYWAAYLLACLSTKRWRCSAIRALPLGLLLVVLLFQVGSSIGFAAAEPLPVLPNIQPLAAAVENDIFHSPRSLPLVLYANATPPASLQALSLYLESTLALRQGDIPRALTALREAARQDNASSWLWTMLAALYWEQGEAALAEASLARALAQGGKSYEMFLMQGLVQLRKDELGQAQQAFEAASTFDPQDPRANEILGMLYARNGDLAKAVAALDKALEQAPHNLDARLLRARCLSAQQNFSSAAKDLREIIAQLPREPFYEELASLHRRQGDAVQEIAVYQEALRIFPESCELRGNLAQRLAASGEAARAEALLWNQDNATLWCPGFIEPLAWLYLQAGNYSRVVALLQDAIQSRQVKERLLRDKKQGAEQGVQTDRQVGRGVGEGADQRAERASAILEQKEYYFLGLAYEGLNDNKEALQAYANIDSSSPLAAIARLREARILADNAQTPLAIAKLASILPAPALPEASLLLAKLYSLQGDWQRAEATLRAALAGNENNTDVLYSLGFLLSNTGREKDAIVIMRRILSLAPNHTEALNFIGYSYAEQGINLNEAQALIARALAQEPRRGQLLDSMGWVLFQQKRYAEAQKYLTEARRQLPEESIVAEHLAQAYEKTGHRQEAIEIYRWLLQKNPEAGEHLLRQIQKLTDKKPVQKHKKFVKAKKARQQRASASHYRTPRTAPPSERTAGGANASLANRHPDKPRPAPIKRLL